MIFRQFFGGSSYGEPAGGTFSPWGNLSNNAIKALLSIALVLVGLGALVLIFPLVLAFFVAGLFFFIAFLCLSWAWKIYRLRRGASAERKYVDVRVENIEE